MRRGIPVTNLVDKLWIRSAMMFGEQTGIPFSKCGRTKAPYKGM